MHNPEKRLPGAMLGPKERLNPLAVTHVPSQHHLIGPDTWLNCGYIVNPAGDFRGTTGNFEGMPMMQRPDMRVLTHAGGLAERPCQHNEGLNRCTERAAVCRVACRVDLGLSRQNSVYCNLHSIMMCENCIQGPFCLRCSHAAGHGCVTGYRVMAADGERWKQTSQLAHCRIRGFEHVPEATYQIWWSALSIRIHERVLDSIRAADIVHSEVNAWPRDLSGRTCLSKMGSVKRWLNYFTGQGTALLAPSVPFR